jgi:hypothetical protein
MTYLTAGAADDAQQTLSLAGLTLAPPPRRREKTGRNLEPGAPANLDQESGLVNKG